MPRSDESTHVPNMRGALTLDERLDRFEELLRDIRGDIKAQNERLSAGDVRFEVLSLKVAALEKVLYGVCGLVGLAVVGAILKSVVAGGAS